MRSGQEMGLTGSEWVFRAPARAGQQVAARGAPPAFSVLICAHQAAGVVAGAVCSALEQTLPPLEVVVVDDGSTDDIAGALRPFADRVRLVRTAHVGLPAARNVGLGVVRGEFVAFLDADDAYEPQFLAALAALAGARPDLDVLTADTWFDAVSGPAGTFHSANPFPVGDQRAAVLAGCFLTMMSAVRRSRLREIGGFDARLVHGEDWDMWIRLVLAGARIGLVDAPLSHYRLHGDQLSAARAASLRGRYEIMAGLLGRPDLTTAERSAVAARLPALQIRAAVTTAAESRGARARWAWLRVASLPTASARLRLLGVVGAAWPRLGLALSGRRGR